MSWNVFTDFALLSTVWTKWFKFFSFEDMYNIRFDAALCQEFDSLNFVFLDKMIFNFG